MKWSCFVLLFIDLKEILNTKQGKRAADSRQGFGPVSRTQKASLLWFWHLACLTHTASPIDLKESLAWIKTSRWTSPGNGGSNLGPDSLLPCSLCGYKRGCYMGVKSHLSVLVLCCMVHSHSKPLFWAESMLYLVQLSRGWEKAFAFHLGDRWAGDRAALM